MQWKRIDPENLSTFPYQVFGNCCSWLMVLQKKLNSMKATDINMWLKQAFLGLTLVLVLLIEYNGNCTVNFPCNIEKIILTVCLMVFYTAISRERLLWGRVFPFKYNISEWNKTLFTSLVLKWLLLKRDLSNPDCLLQWRGREWNSHFLPQQSLVPCVAWRICGAQPHELSPMDFKSFAFQTWEELHQL